LGCGLTFFFSHYTELWSESNDFFVMYFVKYSANLALVGASFISFASPFFQAKLA